MAEEFVPAWELGAEWQVELTSTYQDMQRGPGDDGLRQARSVWRLRVEEVPPPLAGLVGEEEDTVEDVQWEILVAEKPRRYVVSMQRIDPQPAAARYLLLFRELPLALAEIVLEEGERWSTLATNGAQSYYVPDDLFALLLDFPFFPLELAAPTRRFIAADGSEAIERATDLGGGALAVRFEVDLPLEVRYGEQRWEAGKPWWTEARRVSLGKMAIGGEPEPWVYAAGRLL